MTIDLPWLQANAWWLLGVGAAVAWWYLNKKPLAGMKFPAIPVRIVPDDQPKG